MLRLRHLMIVPLLLAIICTYSCDLSIDLLVKSGSKEATIKVDCDVPYNVLRSKIAHAFGHPLDADVFAIHPVNSNFAYLAGDDIVSDEKMAELGSIRWLSVLIFAKPVGSCVKTKL